MVEYKRRPTAPPALSFDLERLLSDLEHDLERARGFVPALALELPRNLHYMSEALEDGRFGTIRLHAHLLASLFNSLLAHDASDAARKLEAVSAHDTVQTEKALHALAREIDRLLGDLMDVLRSGDAVG